MKDYKLSNGLRVISIPMVGTKTATVLVMFKTGSKYETRANNGISHFLEHMFFKGTEKRPTNMDISAELDSLGAEYNAFTSKEYTGYWVKIDSTKFEQAIDIISDMLISSKFDQEEIDREKGVIIEEINMYHENPMYYIEDLFEQCLYGDTPAGWEIVGPKENIKKFNRSDFMDYFKTQYGVGSATVCLAGNIGDSDNLLEKYFSAISTSEFVDKEKVIEKQEEPKAIIYKKEGDQTNISVGVRAYPIGHKDEYILKVLSVVLGGSMSSRMFHEVRERRGLAYYVRTDYESFTDTGYLSTQAGVPVGKQDEAIKVILGEYKKARSGDIKEEELQRAKDLIKGKSIIHLEASDDMANWYGRQSALRGSVRSPEEFFELIDRVTLEDIKRVSEDIFKDNGLNLAVIGPFDNDQEFLDILTLA